MNKRITRRGFFGLTGKRTLAGLIAGAGIIGYSAEVEPSWMAVEQIDLPLRGLSPEFNGLRMVQISDIHMGGWMNRRRLAEVVELVLSLRPDVVALTGDYVTARDRGHNDQQPPSYFKPLTDLAIALRPLKQVEHVVAVMGNHDHRAGAAQVRAMLAEAGIQELKNSVLSLIRGNSALHLAGIDDFYAGHDWLDRVLYRLPPTGPAILLAHEPDFADTSAKTGRFSLQISGHSHGGQVVLPFLPPLVLPKYAQKYPSGLYQVGQMLQYTNRGIGMAEIAIRFNCRPEVTLFVFSSAS